MMSWGMSIEMMEDEENEDEGGEVEGGSRRGRQRTWILVSSSSSLSGSSGPIEQCIHTSLSFPEFAVVSFAFSELVTRVNLLDELFCFSSREVSHPWSRVPGVSKRPACISRSLLLAILGLSSRIYVWYGR